jgi:hypothetical protein
MVAEKNAAFIEAWQAMALQAFRANQGFAMSLWKTMWLPALWGRSGAARAAAQVQGAALGLMAEGLAPVHRKAVANAKRLARTRLR